MALHSGLSRARLRARRARAAMDLPDDRARAEAELARLVPRPAPRRPAFLQTVLRLERLAPGGGVVRASLDGAVQRFVTRAATAHLAAWRRAGAQQVTVMVVRRGSREVLADGASAGYASQPAGAIVGAWVGRADARPMAGLSSARAAAQLAQAVMLHLHGLGRADLEWMACWLHAAAP